MSGWIRRIVSYVRGRIAWIRTPEALKRQIVAHEAGHAFTAWHLEAVSAVLEVSAIPLGPYRGYTLTSNRSEYPSVDEVFGLMIMSMAGMAAEQVLLGEVGEGGQADVIHVVAHWLMIQDGASPGEAYRIAAAAMVDLYGDDGARRAMAEDFIGTIIVAFHAAAVALLEPRKQALAGLAKALRRKKVLRERHLRRILGPRRYVTVEALFKAVVAEPS